MLASLACGGSEPDFPPIGEHGDESHALSWFRRFAMDRVIDYRVWSGARSGFAVLVARKGAIVYARTSGLADIEKAVPMALDTRFHIASMTKPITAVAALILVEEGRLGLDDPVSQYIPSFANPEVVTDRIAEDEWVTQPLAEPILIRDLLTFRSGIGGYSESDDAFDRAWRSPDIEVAGLGSLEDRIELVSRLPLYERPGTKWRYGWSLDVLARVIEVAADEPFDSFLQRRLFDPLGMKDTGFPGRLRGDAPLAKMYTHAEDGSLVHDPQFDDYYGYGWTPGGGGLVSTANDYMRFALMLANGGVLEGVRILEAATVENMTRLHVASGVLEDMQIEGLGWGLGVCVVADDSKTIMPARNGDYWWSGRFGTQFWISPTKETVVVLMQQTERGPYSDLPVTASIVQTIAMQ
jgi:CubicO group peptidase (beta-lactamase class C family)